MPLRISVDRERIAEFCRKHHIQKLAVFGSALREDFRPDSDVDVLVWFVPEEHITLFDMVAMEDELTEIIGRKVDLRTPEDLSRLFRQEVVEESEVQYAA